MHVKPAGRSSYPVRAGNLVVPLIDGTTAFRRICRVVDTAEHSVWVTVAFVERDAQMPDGQGTFFDVLDRAAARGIDVRLLFWDDAEVASKIVDSQIFPATADSHAYLRERESLVRARWDHVDGHCHHQKSWVIDAGGEGETAFVGGMNIDCASMVAPGHREGGGYLGYGGIHDAYVELRGPATSDVAHNFVQRWNQASRRGTAEGSYPSADAAANLGYPACLAAHAGPTPVQITRSVLPGLYAPAAAPPEAEVFAIDQGESSIGEQYANALAAARSAIYLENQIFLCPGLFTGIKAALERGVTVVAVAPPRAMPEILRVADDPRVRPILDMLADLGGYANFTMAALAAARVDDSAVDVYVHSKLAIVDDGWATIGSANALFRSWLGDTEMNASFWDAGVVRKLRCELVREHTGTDTGDLDACSALEHFADVARANARRRARGEALDGLAYAIDPARWAR